MALNDQDPMEKVELCAGTACPQCNRPILEEETLTCHGCFEELHCLCFNDPIPPQAYNILKDELSSVFIFCPTCKAKLFAHKIFDKTTSSDCQTRLDNLETQMSKLIAVLSESASSIQGHKALSPPQTPHTFPNKPFKPQTPINGHTGTGTRDVHSNVLFRSTGSGSGTMPKSILKSRRSEDRDFALALSGHDQLKYLKTGSKSPVAQDIKIHPNQSQNKSKVTGKSVTSEARGYTRPQPYALPVSSVSGGLSPVDPKVACQTLKAFCFRKTKNDDTQKEVLK